MFDDQSSSSVGDIGGLIRLSRANCFIRMSHRAGRAEGVDVSRPRVKQLTPRMSDYARLDLLIASTMISSFAIHPNKLLMKLRNLSAAGFLLCLELASNQQKPNQTFRRGFDPSYLTIRYNSERQSFGSHSAEAAVPRSVYVVRVK